MIVCVLIRLEQNLRGEGYVNALDAEMLVRDDCSSSDDTRLTLARWDEPELALETTQSKPCNDRDSQLVVIGDVVSFS